MQTHNRQMKKKAEGQPPLAGNQKRRESKENPRHRAMKDKP